MTDEVINDVVDDVAVDAPIEDNVEETPENEENPEVAVSGDEPELNAEDLEEAKEEVKDTLKKLNIKVDGKEIEREIDLADEAELIKILQMAEMSQSRAQEAAELRKNDMTRNAQLEEFLDTLKSNPEVILEQMGIDVLDFAGEIANREVKKMEMTPEELELAELREELTKIKENEAKAKEESETREMEALRDKYALDYEKNLLDSIAEHELPNSPHIINQMVNMVTVAHENGIDLNFSDVAPLVKEEYESDMRNRISGLSADDLVALLSDDKLSNLVAKAIPEKPKEAPVTLSDIAETGVSNKDDNGAKFRNKSAEDFFRKVRFGE